MNYIILYNYYGKVIDVMYKIEFNDEMTIEGIIESFKNLEDAEIESYIEIDGVKILWNDKDRDNKIKKVLQKHKMKREQSIFLYFSLGFLLPENHMIISQLRR